MSAAAIARGAMDLVRFACGRGAGLRRFARSLREAGTIGAGAVTLTITIAGCAASVPLPRDGDREAEQRVLVPSPPPVPRVEMVPPAPEGAHDEVWVSGQWLWSGQRWEWQSGRWETPPEGATYAPPVLVYLDDKQIAWLPGKWRLPARK